MASGRPATTRRPLQIPQIVDATGGVQAVGEDAVGAGRRWAKIKRWAHPAFARRVPGKGADVAWWEVAMTVDEGLMEGRNQ